MVGFNQVRRVGLLAAGFAALALAGCSDYGGSLPKHMRPLDSKTRELVDRKGMELRSPILVRIFKEEAELEVWKQQKATGRYALLKDYEICAWSGVLGPKKKEGDRQAPEGFYTIRPAQMNPDSNYYLAFNMGYPNDYDRAHGRTGAELMVHGACSSRGCYSMTDENIQEIYTLGRLAFQGGQRDFQVQAFPFRMTPENMARHRKDPNMPFWRMLKEGYDHFEVVGQPPKVDVCGQRYVFNSTPAAGTTFKPTASCPPMSMPDPIRVAVAEKEAKDAEKMLAIAARLDRKENADGASALMLALAEPTSTKLAGPMSVATAPPDLDPQTTASVEAAAAASAVAATAAAPDLAPPPSPRPATVAVEAAPAAASAPAAAIEAGFLPIPELRPAQEAATPPQAQPQPAEASPAADQATLAERMLVESTPADPDVASAYAAAAAEEGGLTGFVLRLFNEEEAARSNP